MDLSSITSPGRAASRIESSIKRELREEDLLLLASAAPIAALPIKKLSERHHRLARLLAAGEKPGVAGIICGYEPSRVSILQASPAFRELMEFYRDLKDREFAGTFEQLAGLGSDAVGLLRERLEEQINPTDETIPIGVGALLEIAKMSLDRSGLGPTSTQKNLNVNINFASRLDEARRRARSTALGIIDAEVIETPEGGANQRTPFESEGPRP